MLGRSHFFISETKMISQLLINKKQITAAGSSYSGKLFIWGTQEARTFKIDSLGNHYVILTSRIRITIPRKWHFPYLQFVEFCHIEFNMIFGWAAFSFCIQTQNKCPPWTQLHNSLVKVTELGHRWLFHTWKSC